MDLLERDEPLRRLREALAQAAAGSGRIVAIAGEAGAGKTTLVDRFVAGDEARALVYWGACENLTTPEPLLPLRDVARGSKGRFTFDPASDYFQSFEALLRLLSDGGAPSVLVLEDVHWADTATLDLIRFLGRRIARIRALVVITYRTDEICARSPLRDVLGETPTASITRLTLDPLSLAAVTRLAARKGRSGAALYAMTGGNPFFVSEILAVDGAAAPDAVRDATLARAARLPDAARLVLDAVSIFPRRAGAALVADMVGAAFEAGTDACIDGGMLVAEDDAFRFRHEIARRALEASLAPTLRRRLHQKLVDALKVDPQARPSEVVHHAERAGDIGTLVEFARRAGDDAARAGAHREAAAHYATMLDHRAALDADTTVTTLECHAEHAYLIGAGNVAVNSMLEAAELRRKSGDTIGFGRNLTRLARFAWICGRRKEAERFIAEAIEVLQTAPAGAELAWAYSHKSQLDMLAFARASAIEWGMRALELAEALGEQEIIIHALANIGTARSDRAGPAGPDELVRSFELARAGDYHDHVGRSACNLACAAYWRRDDRAALAYIEQGTLYALARDLTHWEVYLRGWGAMVRLDLGEWSAAEKELGEILAWTSAVDLFRFPALLALARLRTRRGELDVDSPLNVARPVAIDLDELQRLVYIAVADAERVWLGAEDGGQAANALRAVHRRAVEGDTQWVAEDTALWLHLLGEPVSTTGLSQVFQDHCAGRWREAAAGWRARNRPYEEAIALGSGDEAAQREALAIFDRLGAVPAAARLRRQMRACGTRAIPRGPLAGTRAHPAGLTRRQTQVLALLAEELTNAEIADRLCISAKTAEHHVAAIMARLEAGTRRDAAAAARQRGLLDVAEN